MGTEKVCGMEQGSRVQGSNKDKTYSTISLETKTEADIFHGSDSEWLHMRCEEWKQNFRISRETFKVLRNKLKPSLERRVVTRQPLSVEHRVAATLWRLRTNVEFPTISYLFEVGISTACVTLRDVYSAIVEKLAPRFIAVPCGIELEAVVE